MPKNTKKRTQVKDLPRSKKDLSSKAAKKVRGGFEQAGLVQVCGVVRKVGGGAKGSPTL